jgi:hypothetical protein
MPTSRRHRDGIAMAHTLAMTHGVRDVLLVDERAPLTLTSDKSTEAYRKWSDISDDRFGLNRRGYLYATPSAGIFRGCTATSSRCCAHGDADSSAASSWACTCWRKRRRPVLVNAAGPRRRAVPCMERRRARRIRR